MAKYTKREYQLGPYYLDRRDGSPAWYRCWVEGRRTKRISLGTADFEEAKQKLNQFWAEQYKLSATDRPLHEVKLAEVILDYWNNQASKLRSAQSVKISLRYWNEWWGDATLADVRNYAKQDEFREHLKAKGLAPKSVERVLEAGRAAMRRAWRRGHIMASPHVEVPPAQTKGPKGRPMTPEEIGKLLGGTAEAHIQLFILLMLGTAGRNEAVMDLTWEAIDFDAGLIHLNPEGRAQTSKRRPTVKLPDTLRAILWPRRGTGSLFVFRGKVVKKVENGWHKMVKRSGLKGNVTAYSLRHTAARWMRMQGVPMEEIANQLGHKMPSYSMTEVYTSYGPDYLNKACAALDKLLALVQYKAHMLVHVGNNQETEKESNGQVRL